MSELEERVRGLRQEIAAVGAAPEPAGDILGAEMDRFDRAVAAFEAAPFRPRVWSPGPPSWEAIEHMVMGAMGRLVPGAREHFEQHAAGKLAAYPGLRLSAADKAGRLQQLAHDLRVAEAMLEVDRRRHEQANGEVLPRADASPEIWLLHQDDLAAVAAGKELSP